MMKTRERPALHSCSRAYLRVSDWPWKKKRRWYAEIKFLKITLFLLSLTGSDDGWR